ncbi:MAG: hypothetical protein K8R36_17070 [Planctomycetales bacterium]|nr:hypothetical protein [Planctomycetales bacterium]
MSDTLMELMDAKNVMRRAAYDARKAQADKERVSEAAVAALMQLPEYQQARTVLWYLDCRSELRTGHALPGALASGKRAGEKTEKKFRRSVSIWSSCRGSASAAAAAGWGTARDITTGCWSGCGPIAR